MAEHYKQEVIQGVIVAIPSAGQSESTLFSDFNIGAASAYYEKINERVMLMAPCESDDGRSDVYKVVNQNNYFYAQLHCGLNTVPQVYVSGAHLSVSKK
jgi:hypothetical protein